MTGPSIPKDRYAHLLGESLLGVLEVLLLGALLLGVLLLDVPLLDVLRDAVVLLPGAEALCLPCAAFASARLYCGIVILYDQTSGAKLHINDPPQTTPNCFNGRSCCRASRHSRRRSTEGCRQTTCDFTSSAPQQDPQVKDS